MRRLYTIIFLLVSVIPCFCQNSQNEDLIDKALSSIQNGNNEAAVQYLERYRTEYKFETKEDSVWYFYSIALEGSVFGLTGDWATARYYMELAKSGLFLMDDKNPQLINIYNMLAQFYMEVRSYDLAYQNYMNSKLVLEANNNIYTEYVVCLSNLSNCLAFQYRFEESYLFADAAVRRSNKLLTEEKYKDYWTNMSEDLRQKEKNELFNITNTYKFIKEFLGINTETDKSCISVLKNTFTNGNNNLVKMYMQIATSYYKKENWSVSSKFLKKALSEVENNGLTVNTTDFAKNFISESESITLEIEKYKANLYYMLTSSTWTDGQSECTQWAKKCFDYRSKDINDKFSYLTEHERNKFLENEDIFKWLNRTILDYGTVEDYPYMYDAQILRKGLLVRSTRDARDIVISSGSKDLKEKQDKIDKLRKQILIESDPQKRYKLTLDAENLEQEVMLEVKRLQKEKNVGDVRWSSVRDSLKDDDIAIEFFYLPYFSIEDSIKGTNFKSSYYALTLKKGYRHPHLIKIADEDQVKSLDKYVTPNNQKLYDLNNVKLYNLIWGPLEKELSSVKNVCFAADNELHNIAIEYARNGDGERFNDKYNVNRLSSTRVIAERKRHEPSGKAVLYGGLYYDLDTATIRKESDKYPQVRGIGFDMEEDSVLTRAAVKYLKYLPGTKKEVSSISDMMRETGSKAPAVYMASQGNEESVRALSGENIDILFLATHGMFLSGEEKKYNMMSNILDVSNVMARPDRSMYSGLFMSGVNTILKNGKKEGMEDGYLMAKEIAGLDFSKVDLVTLSACETGLGESGGDGAFGLQRGFKLAGVNTILMSLWKVDDNATWWFMKSFFEHFLSGRSKEESLKYAQEQVRKYKAEWNDPVYWAGFILLDGIN